MRRDPRVSASSIIKGYAASNHAADGLGDGGKIHKSTEIASLKEHPDLFDWLSIELQLQKQRSFQLAPQEGLTAIISFVLVGERPRRSKV